MDLHDESNNMNEKWRIERNKGRRERYRLRQEQNKQQQEPCK